MHACTPSRFQGFELLEIIDNTHRQRSLSVTPELPDCLSTYENVAPASHTQQHHAPMRGKLESGSVFEHVDRDKNSEVSHGETLESREWEQRERER